MSRTGIILALIVCGILPPAHAAEDEDYARSRRRLIEANLPLTPEEAARFWPIYDQYWKELSALTARREAYYVELGNNFDSMTDEHAKRIVLEHISLEEERYRLLRTFFPKFATAILAKKAARYYQIEAKIQAAVNAEIAERIPLIK
ncbi:conserved hypothetical protein [Methylococcus capsulatus str. Bath]|uniref:Lipoprotein n=2 Tax=Methylococcus capsulatus TaxID=414 RepID=Q604G9_METCA|nr:hypothetical protein [Methylococcus capsulatus]AAU91346.1 conserved hypothetical protein [Methylococcus capsulatus str. Bath]CAI8824596.1 conserved exported protein of unknown function [Methylococcus capsulatus]